MKRFLMKISDYKAVFSDFPVFIDNNEIYGNVVEIQKLISANSNIVCVGAKQEKDYSFVKDDDIEIVLDCDKRLFVFGEKMSGMNKTILNYAFVV